MTIVVDASFSGAWLLPDEHSGKADRVLAAVLHGEETLAAPELWTYEMLNLLVSAQRRGRIEARQLEPALRLMEGIPVEFFDHQSRIARVRLARFATRFSLSAYDAAYLELADRLQCPLRSLDKDLAGAARTLGLE